MLLVVHSHYKMLTFSLSLPSTNLHGWDLIHHRLSVPDPDTHPSLLCWTRGFEGIVPSRETATVMAEETIDGSKNSPVSDQTIIS